MLPADKKSTKPINSKTIAKNRQDIKTRKKNSQKITHKKRE